MTQYTGTSPQTEHNNREKDRDNHVSGVYEGGEGRVIHGSDLAKFHDLVAKHGGTVSTVHTRRFTVPRTSLKAFHTDTAKAGYPHGSHWRVPYSQHSSEEVKPLPEYVPRESLNVSGAPAVFGSASLARVKPEPEEETTQHAEGGLISGRSAFLATDRKGNFGTKSKPHPMLHKLLKKFGGAVHNPHGGFTLPKHAAEAFNQAASGAGFQHGYHYSLKG